MIVAQDRGDVPDIAQTTGVLAVPLCYPLLAFVFTLPANNFWSTLDLALTLNHQSVHAMWSTTDKSAAETSIVNHTKAKVQGVV